MSADVRARVEAVWRIESAKLIAALARVTHDVGLAEELAQDALVAALEQWPGEGVPRNPAAWLMTTAKRRAIDRFRRQDMLDKKHAEIARTLETEHEAELPPPIEDDLLRLIFIACHPVLNPEARTALTLKLLGGLTTAEIARAFLVSEPTVAQRIVRAKRALQSADAEFEIPEAAELPQRLDSVLEVIYLIYNEGYAATAGEDWMRPELCSEAMRLGRILAGLMPREPEVHGLVALMELQASRINARTSPDGEPITLLEQNRGRWDHLLIRRGLDALAKTDGRQGKYALQAALAACHARARTAAETDWREIARIYGQLNELEPSPIIDLNRAVAVSMADGPEAGLAILDNVELPDYHLLPAVRADLFAKLGRLDDARIEFERAAGLTRNERERAFLLNRARDLR
ncbi:MAG: RNA polymerase sigma factor [Nocardiaceae bacterium]|nr:RNA polymerase sigma factor [Nocardiaceae bacterium]